MSVASGIDRIVVPFVVEVRVVGVVVGVTDRGAWDAGRLPRLQLPPEELWFGWPFRRWLLPIAEPLA